ncbi:MAG TPA: nucleotidyltransferase domain-containing protein [Burkholderiales bacterium]|nr:nucleotidyltransferase domain-containing protein [Burkholderiales bacterium]
MGRKTGSSGSPSRGLADALFSVGQQRVLGLLFGQPERSFYANELIALAGGGSGAIQRELERLAQSGLVTVRRIGSQKHFQANPESALFGELTGIVRKTFGLANPLREALAPLGKRVAAAFVYGSVAKRSDTARSDIDLVVVSDKLAYPDVYAVLEPLHDRLGRQVNPTVYTRKMLARRMKSDNAFVKRVLDQPKIWIIGSERDLAA